MDKFNFNGVNINATNIHIGDNYIYNSPQDFIKNNTNLAITETETELIKIIFDNTESEQERKTILDSLKSIKEGKGTEEEKRAFLLSFKPLLKKLSDIGEKVAVNIVSKLLTDYAGTHNLKDLVHSITSNQ